MILVGRPAQVPASLADGAVVTAANCALRDASPQDAEEGKAKFRFLKSIYGPKATKRVFSVAQHSKCCFCEGVFDAHYAGDVEHYRPKKSIREGNVRTYPGYYWLAYDFSNLFFACADCNQYRKKDQFPLVNDGNRARSHHDNITLEDPLILCPGGPRDPRQHIRFYNDVPMGVTEAGKRTVTALRLDREPLNRLRRRLIIRLREHEDTVAHLAGDPRPEIIAKVARARQELQEAVLPSSEFSAVAQDFIAKWRP